MKLGLDVDGVLANFNHGFIEVIKKETGKELPPASDTFPDCWNYPEKFGLDGQALLEKCHTDHFWVGLRPMPEAQDLLIELADCVVFEGDTVVFITSRQGKRVHWQTCQWLRKNDYHEFPTVLIADDAEQKGELAAALCLDAFIDDKPENCEAVAGQGVQTFLLDRPWNRDVGELYGIKRVTSLWDFYEEVTGGCRTN